MLAFIIINQCMYHSRSIFHSVILFHFRWRRKRETSASSSKATPPPLSGYLSSEDCLTRKRKPTFYFTTHQNRKIPLLLFRREAALSFLFWVKLVDCADASCEHPMAMSQMTPKILQHNLQAWVFSFPSRARGMNEWEREVWEDGEQFQFFLPEQQHYLTVFECARPTTHT